MIIVTTSRNVLKSVIIIVLAGIAGFCLYYRIHSINPLYQAHLDAFLASSGNYSHGSKMVEVFDIRKGEVIQRLHPDSALLDEAVQCLEKITGMYVKVKAFPDKGHIIRVPFKSAVSIKNPWLNADGINLVEEVFFIFPGNEEPYLLVLDDYKKPFFYTFKHKIKEISKIL